MKISYPAGLEGVGSGRTALVTGVYGQDGSYMLDLLLALGYEVWGGCRHSMSRDDKNIRHNLPNPRFRLCDFDITQPLQVNRALRDIKPDEIYNFAALSRVGPSFEDPRAYLEANAMGVIYLTDAMAKYRPDAKMFQACTSEQWGSQPPPQGYDTEFRPDSPYAVSKVAAYWHCLLEQERGLYCAVGLTCNHESARRPNSFVTTKIIDHFAGYERGSVLELGNVSAGRDWGYAPEFILGFWGLLQRDEPEVALFGTGEAATVEDLLVLCARDAGLDVPTRVSGNARESWTLEAVGELVARSNAAYVRPNKNSFHLSAKAVEMTRDQIGWQARTKFAELVQLMGFASVRGELEVRFDGLVDRAMLTELEV